MHHQKKYWLESGQCFLTTFDQCHLDLILGRAYVRSTSNGSHSCRTGAMLYRFKFLMNGIFENLVTNNIT